MSDSNRLDDYAEVRYGLLRAINEHGYNFTGRPGEKRPSIMESIDTDDGLCWCRACYVDLGLGEDHSDDCEVVRSLAQLAALDRLCPEEAAEGRRLRGEVTRPACRSCRCEGFRLSDAGRCDGCEASAANTTTHPPIPGNPSAP